MDPQPKQTIAFGATILLGLIVLFFIFKENILSFPNHYGFIQLAGIFIASAIIGSVIYALAAGIMNMLFKIMVEILAGALVVFNIFFVAIVWADFDYFSMEFYPISKLWDFNLVPLTIIGLTIVLLIANLITALVLIPLARTAKTDVLDV